MKMILKMIITNQEDNMDTLWLQHIFEIVYEGLYTNWHDYSRKIAFETRGTKYLNLKACIDLLSLN